MRTADQSQEEACLKNTQLMKLFKALTNRISFNRNRINFKIMLRWNSKMLPSCLVNRKIHTSNHFKVVVIIRWYQSQSFRSNDLIKPMPWTHQKWRSKEFESRIRHQAKRVMLPGRLRFQTKISCKNYQISDNHIIKTNQRIMVSLIPAEAPTQGMWIEISLELGAQVNSLIRSTHRCIQVRLELRHWNHLWEILVEKKIRIELFCRFRFGKIRRIMLICRPQARACKATYLRIRNILINKLWSWIKRSLKLWWECGLIKV